jgi:DNA-binding transcriptional LysR family regulator
VALELVPAEAADATALLLAHADAGLVRMPVDRTTYQAIPLYTETTVVVFPRDHLFAAADDMTLADLVDETLVSPGDDVLDWGGTSLEGPATTAAAVELVAAGGGVLVVPQSLARLYHRRDLTYRTVGDAPTSTVGLAWASDRHTDLVEQMIGIVRGRTANSTRGTAPSAPDRNASPRRRRRR